MLAKDVSENTASRIVAKSNSTKSSPCARVILKCVTTRFRDVYWAFAIASFVGEMSCIAAPTSGLQVTPMYCANVC